MRTRRTKWEYFPCSCWQGGALPLSYTRNFEGNNNVQRPAWRNLLIVLPDLKILEILNPNRALTASHLQRITMKTSFIVCICWMALATGLFAQAPTASPTTSVPVASVPVATPTVSPASTPESEIERSIRKKQKKHFNFTVGDRETDADRAKSSEDIPAMVIPLVGIVFLTIFGAPILIVAVIMYFGFSKNRMMHRTIRLMVEKGQPVPPALLAPPAPAQRQRSDMRRGAVLVQIGPGLKLFLAAANDWEGGAWSIGIIPFLIGAGYLLVWKLEGKKDNAPPVP